MTDRACSTPLVIATANGVGHAMRNSFADRTVSVKYYVLFCC